MLGALSSCSPRFAPERLAAARLKPGDHAPATHEPALVVRGAISNTNQQDTLALDLETLEQLGVVQYKVDDPWLNQPVVYSGVLLADLWRFAGADEAATIARVSAWDHYTVDIRREEIEQWSILVATRAEGETMAMDHGGPTRLILPYQHHPDVAHARNLSVWNIREIEIR